MGSNRCGQVFTYTTWGESHGNMIGVVLDGCPAGLEISEQELNVAMQHRRPGLSLFTSPRKEDDLCEILSGVYEGKTTGAPIAIIIKNRDVDSSKYEPIKNVFRPGHAQFTYFTKYGICDPYGGGRASARETACRVCIGAIAKKILNMMKVEVCGFLKSIASIEAYCDVDFDELKKLKSQDPLGCPDPAASVRMQEFLKTLIQEGDSIGGCVEVHTTPLPVGLGDPVYEKLEANLGKALLSIPAVKGVVFGDERECLLMKGSLYRDAFIKKENSVITETNYSAGLLGGISNGMPLKIRVFFKPTSSITAPIASINTSMQQQMSYIPQGSRHDPCVAIRGVAVAEAMVAITLVDASFINRLSRLN